MRKYFLIKEISEEEFHDLLKANNWQSELDLTYLGTEMFFLEDKTILIGTKEEEVEFETGIEEDDNDNILCEND